MTGEVEMKGLLAGADGGQTLEWKSVGGNHLEAWLGEPGKGVRFTVEHYPTCYRRGRWRCLVEVASGPDHYKWGCFDDADQPMRWYHSLISALFEMDAIATVLLDDFRKATSGG